jgi:pimeloyl-ACP methyl ester carboxylesterase
LHKVGRHVGAIDRPGSGASPGRGGDVSVEEVVGDVARAVSLASPGPVLIVGYSWGALTAAALCRTIPERIGAAAFLAPGFAVKVGYSRSEKIVIAGALAFTKQKRFESPIRPISRFSSDTAVCEWILSDPLRRTEFGPRLLATTQTETRRLRRSGRLGVPAAAFWAPADGIVDNGAARRVLESLAPGAAQFDVPGAEHAFILTHAADAVARDLESWVAGVEAARTNRR